MQSIAELDDGTALVVHLDEITSSEPSADSRSVIAAAGECTTQVGNEAVVTSLRKVLPVLTLSPVVAFACRAVSVLPHSAETESLVVVHM